MESSLKAVHVWVATSSILLGMAAMLLVAGRWQGEVGTQLQNVAEQVTGLRSDMNTIAKQVQSNATTIAVNGEQIKSIEKRQEAMDSPSFQRGRQFDK